jgi:hypothetical protein
VPRYDPIARGDGDLALKHGELVLKHEDLGVFGHPVHPVDADRFKDAADEAVKERERHGQRASSSLTCLVKPANE